MPTDPKSPKATGDTSSTPPEGTTVLGEPPADGVPSLADAGTEVPAETGTASGGTEPTETEKAELAEKAEEANLTPKERAEKRREERREQQERAGQDAGEDPLPLSKSGNRGAPVDVEIGDETVSLSAEEKAVLRTLPTTSTAVDGQGVTRIVTPDLNEQGWRPAPVEPDPAEVARLEKMTAAIAAQDAQRLQALGLGSSS